MNSLYNTVIFDLGGVLIDWNPEYLYRKTLHRRSGDATLPYGGCVTYRGTKSRTGGARLPKRCKSGAQCFPQYESQIRSYHERWDEMLGGTIEKNVQVLDDLWQKSSVHLYAITNWSAETYPVAQQRFTFLDYFEDVVVSGKLKLVKPDAAIYQVLLDRQPQIVPAQAIFIDDVLENVEAARALGIYGIHLTPETDLREQLEALEVLP